MFFERDGRLHRSEQRFADEGQLRALIDEGLVDSVDLYKVGHHGSKNALDDEEAAVLSPRIALVSAGARNRYGHPAQDTLDRLEAAGARVFRTDEQGDVSCKLTADRIEVETCVRMNGMATQKKQEAPLLPVYLIVGEDALKRDTVMKRLRARLSSMGDLSFNADEFDGETAQGGDIVTACNTVRLRALCVSWRCARPTS
mgnify:CR=1 FL=1